MENSHANCYFLNLFFCHEPDIWAKGGKNDLFSTTEVLNWKINPTGNQPVAFQLRGYGVAKRPVARSLGNDDLSCKPLVLLNMLVKS